MIGKTAIPDDYNPVLDVRPSDGLFENRKAAKAANNPETNALPLYLRDDA